MSMNSTKLIILMMMILSTMISINSNNWMTMWMMLEINMFMFIPMITKKKMIDQPIKYLIIQSTSSSIMLMSIILSMTKELPLNTSTLLTVAMTIKMGMSPFHLWVPQIMKKLTWMNCLIMSTLLKITPMMITSQLLSMKMMLLPMILSMLVGSISGIKQTSIKKIMAYSSITNSAWMLTAFLMSKQITLMFLSTYTIMNMSIIMNMNKSSIMYTNQISSFKKKQNMNLILSMLSISGMPPMLGFYPKWILLKETLMYSFTLTTMMLISSMISMFFYIQMAYTNMLNFSTTKKTKKNNSKLLSFQTMNLMGLMLMFSTFFKT